MAANRNTLSIDRDEDDYPMLDVYSRLGFVCGYCRCGGDLYATTFRNVLNSICSVQKKTCNKCKKTVSSEK